MTIDKAICCSGHRHSKQVKKTVWNCFSPKRWIMYFSTSHWKKCHKIYEMCIIYGQSENLWCAQKIVNRFVMITHRMYRFHLFLLNGSYLMTLSFIAAHHFLIGCIWIGSTWNCNTSYCAANDNCALQICCKNACVQFYFVMKADNKYLYIYEYKHKWFVKKWNTNKPEKNTESKIDWHLVNHTVFHVYSLSMACTHIAYLIKLNTSVKSEWQPARCHRNKNNTDKGTIHILNIVLCFSVTQQTLSVWAWDNSGAHIWNYGHISTGWNTFQTNI